MKWIVGKKEFVFPGRILVVGILNTSADSFSGDGVSNEAEALKRAEELIEEGSDIIDVGGQSTRPGSLEISAAEEIRRTIPIVKKLVKITETPISIDTYKAAVAKAALNEGALIVNDISGFRFDESLPKVVASFGASVCLMHTRGKPSVMQEGEIYYEDVIEAIKKYLSESVEIAFSSGIGREKIVLDPGIGFGKTVEHNFEIIRRLKELKELGFPILIGPSRKSFIGKTLGLPPEKRIFGTAAAVAACAFFGADIVRVHDVAEMREVLKICEKVSGLET